ncbi:MULTISPECIES: sugar transferase [unclassified Mycolicibacterium]|uniref:sugar transferase n=2 Tax=unclassified Mycolicibacterium TaxID=2636767 RepID=UPI002815F126|nr:MULTISPECIES: sugar transferase [unclassified Mycolicibacterium]
MPPSDRSSPPIPTGEASIMAPNRAPGAQLKRGFDVVTASALLIVFSPLLATIALLIRYTAGAPVIFRQQRPGRHGQIFTMYKFRTMRPPSPGENPWATDDLRSTRVGKFLRRTSLDELPQLINVVSGRMSLVGPRPLLVEYLDRYSPHHARRHDVRPGITGLAQVSGRKSVAYSDKLDLDVRYVDEWSFRLDLRILFLTLVEPFKRPETRGYEEFDDLGLTVGLGPEGRAHV